MNNFNKSKHQTSYLIDENENKRIADLIDSQNGIVIMNTV
jgi:hypothetical protein